MGRGAWQAAVHGVEKESDMTEVTERGTVYLKNTTLGFTTRATFLRLKLCPQGIINWG